MKSKIERHQRFPFDIVGRIEVGARTGPNLIDAREDDIAEIVAISGPCAHMSAMPVESECMRCDLAIA